MGRQPCCAKEGLNRGAWTAMEDKILTDYIQLHGPGNWRNLPQRAGLRRCGKSCRLRWINYLRPDIKRGNITEEEEELIIRLHKLLGNRWSLIAGRLPGRTDNEIKNYWNTSISKKLNNTGISRQSSGRKANQPKENAIPAAEAKTENSLVIRTKPRMLYRPIPFRAEAGPSTAGEGGSSLNNVIQENAGELIPKESEANLEFMKDLEIDEKFMLEIFNLEFQGSHDQQQFSPCGNESNANSSSPPDSGNHSGGVLFSDEMLKEYSASLVDPESDWLQDYYIQNAHD